MPYSLHSSFSEIHEFVASICPAEIYPIVSDFPSEDQFFYSGKTEVSKKDLVFNQELFEMPSKDYTNEMLEL